MIGESVDIEGTLRTFDEETKSLILGKIKELLQAIESEGYKVDFESSGGTMTSNSKKEADNVIRVAKAFIGEENVGSGSLPFRASEDFGVYTENCPGAFFFFCTKKSEEEVSLHNPRFNFKDEIIERASGFYLKLALDRISSE